MINSSDSRSRARIWIAVLLVFGIAMSLELVPFIIVNRFFHKTVVELAAPYLLFAATPVICFGWAMWLRNQEGRGLAPRALALGWGLFVVIFFAGIGAAVFCAGVTLHVIDPSELTTFTLVEAAPMPFFMVMVYRAALKRISERAAGSTEQHFQ